MKKVIITVLSLVVISFLFTLLFGYSLVVNPNEKLDLAEMNCEDGEINPFDSFNFSEGSWKMYVQINSSDINELPESIRRVNCLKTTDINVLQNIKNNWNFSCSEGADASTVESKVYLLKDGEVVFESGIVISEAIEGLQNSSFGWIHSNEQLISKELAKFDRVYSPIVFL